MTNTFLIESILCLLVSCGSADNSTKEQSDKAVAEMAYEVKSFEYDSLTISGFFERIVQNHLVDFKKLEASDYAEFCLLKNIDVQDSSNNEKYFTIKILHELFTSKTASNCSRGDILNIPYHWHWIEPNPRHEIFFVSNDLLLINTDPPRQFSKYNSFADIDRTPYLYLSDLVHPTPKYYSASCDTFSTFGWCSEREMAFVCLLELLGYSGEVVAEGNHSWSEFIIPMVSVSDSTVQFKVTVDNTFNSVYWEETDSSFINKWKTENWNSSLEKWYNQKAHSQTEKNKIENHLTSKKAMNRIEGKLINYLEKRIEIETIK